MGTVTRRVGCTLTLLWCAIVCGPWVHAAAASAPARVTVRGGGLVVVAEPSVGDFPDVVLDGDVQRVTAALGDFRVCDARGSGSGWHLSLQATRFAEWDPLRGAYVVGGEMLPPGSLVVDGFTVRRVGATVCPLPDAVRGPFQIDGGGPAVVLVAGPGAGMGAYDVAASGPLELTVPADAAAGVYRSDVTISIDAGP